MFDTVLMARAEGRAVLSPAEFLALPLTERASALLANKVEFRRNGTPVPVIEVMRSLMREAMQRS